MTNQGTTRALSTLLNTKLKWFVFGVAVLAGAHARAASTEIVLHNFAAPPGGANSQSPLTLDRAGSLYGTTQFGGVANAGVVFKVDSSGVETTLHSFTGGNDGGAPLAGLLAYEGVLYGTTLSGGTGNIGLIFALDSTGHETVLYNFTGPDGSGPDSSLIRDARGNLYGTTFAGGSANMGVLYKLTPAGQEIVLHNFTGPDGALPVGGVIFDPEGNLYGTTQGGGIGGGVVYKVDTAGVLTVLHTFMSGADGYFASGGLIHDAAGNLYGSTIGGGALNAGVVFKVEPHAGETVIYSFNGQGDGGQPYGGLIADKSGNLYGCTGNGGADGNGTVFRIDAKAHESVLYSFKGGADGAHPRANVIRDAAGNLYGTTADGGPANIGIVYKLDSAGTETIVLPFTGGPDGTSPQSGVIRDTKGNFYGTAEDGGPAGAGVVYRLDAAGQQTILYSFTGSADGAYPESGVIQDASGNLYGTTLNGGAAGVGVVYRLDPAGHETVLHSFTGGVDGTNPQTGVIQDAHGNLYGTATFGGLFGMGIVYKLSAAGEETIMHSFAGGFDGANPSGFILFDSQNNLYGTTSNGGSHNRGTLYKIDPAGHETVLYAFSGGADGGNPSGGVTLDAAGNLYGTCALSSSGAGTVYKFSTSGQQTVLYGFTGNADGAYPYGAVIRDDAGNLFGTASFGGASNYGVVYEVSAAGQETVLHNFTGGADGAYPYAGLIRDAAGNLFGTTPSGGKRRVGLVFKLKP